MEFYGAYLKPRSMHHALTALGCTLTCTTSVQYLNPAMADAQKIRQETRVQSTEVWGSDKFEYSATERMLEVVGR